MLQQNTLTQAAFFSMLKARLPAHLSLVDELADLLHMSTDSVYRRIRGEKEISLQELCAIVRKFDLSLDRELGYKGSQVGFSCKYLDPATFNFRNYLDEMLSRFR